MPVFIGDIEEVYVTSKVIEEPIIVESIFEVPTFQSVIISGPSYIPSPSSSAYELSPEILQTLPVTPIVLQEVPDNIIEDVIEKEPILIVVDDIEYDISHLTGMQRITVSTLKFTYENFSQSFRDAMPFDIYAYKISKITFLQSLFEATVIIEEEEVPWIEPTLDIDPESPIFSLRLWYSEQRIKIKMFLERTAFLTPFLIILGVIIAGLIGYQYTKSYVSQKAIKKASK